MNEGSESKSELQYKWLPAHAGEYTTATELTSLCKSCQLETC